MPPMSHGPQDPFVEGDMTNVELRDALMDLTRLIITQDQVVTNNLIAQAN